MQEASEFVEICLEIAGVKVQTVVDLEAYSKLDNDPEFLRNYHSQLSSQHQTLVPGHSADCSNILENIDGSTIEADCKSQKKKQEHSNTPTEYFKWDPDATKLLIALRLEANDDFSAPRKCYNKYWDKIVAAFTLEGYNVSREILKSKWKNLLIAYNRNVDKQSKTGESAIEWVYFDSLDEVLGSKKNVAPPKETLGSTLQLIDNQTEALSQKKYDEEQTVCKSASMENSAPLHSPNTLKGMNLHSASQKNNQSEQVQMANTQAAMPKTVKPTLNLPEKATKQNRKRRGDIMYEIKDLLVEKKDKALKVQQSMWDEKKEIERNRTDAILSLAESIHSLKK